jgi:hypothetical protein
VRRRRETHEWLVMVTFHGEKEGVENLHHFSKNHESLVNQALPRNQPQGGAISNYQSESNGIDNNNSGR